MLAFLWPQKHRAAVMMQRLLDSQILTSCSAVFDAFDESLMFHDEFHNITTLKRQFKGVFQVRVSRNFRVTVMALKAQVSCTPWAL